MKRPMCKAWNVKDKKMIDLYKITPLALDSSLKIDGIFIPFDDNLLLLPFVGIKDENLIPLYVGDIVQYDTEDGIAVAEIVEEDFAGEDSNELIRGFKYKFLYHRDCGDNEEVKFLRLGDRYNNPELLQPV